MVFPRWLYIGAMKRKGLSRIHMFADSDWVGKRCFCGPFHLSLTYLLGGCTVAIFSLRYNIEWKLDIE